MGTHDYLRDEREGLSPSRISCHFTSHTHRS